MLLDAGADVNLSHPTSAARAIHIAVRETAVKSSGSKRSSTSVSTTVAAADSDATVAVVVDVPLEILRLILAKNADVNVRDGSGLMPLHIAVHSATMMRLLLAAGADVDSVEPRSAQTPLHLAVKFGKYIYIY